MRRIKIIYLVHQFYPEFFTGTEKFVLNLAEHTQYLGHNVKVITYSFQDNSFFNKTQNNMLMREFTFNGIPIIAIKHMDEPNKKILNQSLEDKNVRALAKQILKNEEPDIIHVAHPMRVTEFISAALELKIPYLITLTDFFFMCPKGILKTKGGDLCFGPKQGSICRKSCPDIPFEFVKERYKQAENILFSANKVISPSRFLVKMFKKEFKDIQIDIIPYGVDEKKCKENNRFYRSQDSLTLCFAGSFYPHKGLLTLLNAFTQIKSPNTLLKLFGSGSNNTYMKKIKRIINNNNNIIYCGVYEEDKVGEIFSNVDVLIVPSLWHENCPLVIHEALACSLPVVASNSDGIAELIRDRVNGFTFHMGDVEHLKNILNQIIINPEILNKIKKRMKKERIFTALNEAENYVEEYHKIIIS